MTNVARKMSNEITRRVSKKTPAHHSSFHFQPPPLASRAVKRLAKILIITAIVLVLLLAVGMWGLNRWLKSPEMHTHVERELSKALRVPLKFQSLELSLWGGLEARGVTVPDQKGNFLEVAGFSAKHSLLSLLRGQLVFQNVVVDSPKFILTQQKDESWRTPPLPADLQAEIDAKKKKKTAPKSDQPKPIKTENASTPKSKKGPAISISKIEITNASIELIEKGGHPYISAKNLRATLTDVSDENMEGALTIDRLIMHNEFALTDVTGSVSNSNKGLIISELKAKVGGGTAIASFSSKPDQPGPPFTTKVKLENVNLSDAASEADAKAPNLDGILSGSLEMKGLGSNRPSYTGKGSLTLRDGNCRELDVVRDIGEVFQMEQFTNFVITEAKSEFDIGQNRAFIRQFTIKASPLGITAQGSVRLDGKKLDLKAMFNADEKLIAKQIPDLQKQFLPPDEKNQRSVAFEIEGSLTKPKNNLVQKITGTKDRKKQKILAIESLILGTRPDKTPDKSDEEKSDPEPKENP